MSIIVRRLAVVSTLGIILFLSASSQVLLRHLDPSPLTQPQLVRFNLLVICLLISFTRVAVSDPGTSQQLAASRIQAWSRSRPKQQVRFCRKCDQVKPDRWHHCRACKTCVPKMDHHCIWLNNCVSHTNLPHFIRFLLYSFAAMCYLQYFLSIRLKVLWDNRNLPHYLGPSALQLLHLFLLSIINFVCCFVVGLLLFRSAYGILMNTTNIESWQLERHEALVERARRSGGFVYGPGGIKVWIKKQEFPYDIGMWRNLKQAMNSSNPFLWFWPLASSPSVHDALDWEVNDFEDSPSSWPPPDPEKMSQVLSYRSQGTDARLQHSSDVSYIEAFRQRQARDMLRGRRPWSTAPLMDGAGAPGEVEDSLSLQSLHVWRNSEGERLEDFGVDTSPETMDEGDIPLSQLIDRKKVQT